MPGQDDIIYDAEINDRTGEFFDRFDQKIDTMEQKSKGAFSGLEEGGDRAAILMGMVGGGVAMLTNKLLEMGYVGAQAFIGYIKEAAMAAARIETLGVALEIAGGHAGYTREELNKFEEDVKGMGITTSKARTALTQMAQADLDLAEAANLARVAQDAAVNAGVDSSEAFNRILYAITTLQPEILRTMNLTVNMQSEMEKYAKTVGKTVGQLSASDKQQAMLNATMRAGEDIAGTYEAAMGTVGKMLTSLPRYFEEIQLAIGNAFQPALLAGVSFLTEKLKDMLRWLEENEDQLATFGTSLAEVMSWLISMTDTLTSTFSTLPGLIESTGFAIAEHLAVAFNLASPEEMEKRRSKLGEYFSQAIVLLGSFAYTGLLVIIEYARLAVESVGPFLKLMGRDVEGAIVAMDAVMENHVRRLAEIGPKWEESVASLQRFTGLMEDAGDETEDAGYEFDKTAKDLQTLTEALETANDRIEDFARNMEDQAAELATKAFRASTEAALRASWAREDMERSHQARIRSIMEQANSSNRTSARRYAKARIDIERDYQRRIRDLQKDFEFNAGELARSRDAVGLLRLMRGHDKALKDAELDRKDRLTDAKAAFSEEMKLMNERIQEQLRKAEEAHRLQLEDYERMKARERQIDALQAKWAEEDRQAAYAKQLAELIIQMGSIEGITQDGLMDLIDLWTLYFGDLTGAAIKYMERLNRVIRPGGAKGDYTPPGGWNPAPNDGGGYGYGQGGRVSQMMSPNDLSLVEQLYRNVQPSAIPRVPASESRRESKNITVKVSGEGLDPYIQRVVANALLEIERNASGG